MFDKPDNEIKMSHLMQDRTATQFGESQEDSVTYEVQAERVYVNHLKTQRQKIENLYSKYDILLKDLKSKDLQIKEKDKTICSLESKCKTLTFATQQSSHVKQQNSDIKTENTNLQKAIAQLQQSYAFLHGQYRSKEMVTSQKYEEMQNLNDQLMSKLRSVTKRYQEREEEFDQKYKNIAHNFEEFKIDAKKARQAQYQENDILKSGILQKQEENKLMKTQNQCLRTRICELETYINEIVSEHEEKCQILQRQKKCQVKTLKNQIQRMKEDNYSLQRKVQKLKGDCELKECSLKEMSLMLEQHEKQRSQVINTLKYQFAQEKSLLKEQLIQCQNHIEMLQRKMADSVRKQQCLHGKIKKYEVCLDAKRNLREIQQQQLDRINSLLNMP